jgi:hypothetical protein
MYGRDKHLRTTHLKKNDLHTFIRNNTEEKAAIAKNVER